MDSIEELPALSSEAINFPEIHTPAAYPVARSQFGVC
jgi:hypothetical protein